MGTPDTERAWAAGFWDGEGCVSLDKRHATPVLGVTQVGDEAEAILLRFLTAVGFPDRRIYVRRDMRPGRDGSPVRRISITGAENVRRAFEQCRPWLSQTKIRQAELALVAHAERKAMYVNYWSSQTHCKRGHLFNEDNTILERRATGMARHCRECRRIRRERARSNE